MPTRRHCDPLGVCVYVMRHEAAPRGGTERGAEDDASRCRANDANNLSRLKMGSARRVTSPVCVRAGGGGGGRRLSR